MSFSSGFKAIADDPNGEALSVRVYLRADTGAGSDQLITLTGLEEVLDISDVKRYREREFGIMQGQQWEVTLANVYDTFNPGGDGWPTTETSILLKWVALQIGFANADEWALVAQGRVHQHRVNLDGTAFLRCGDPIMDILAYETPRDAVFDERDAWVSPVQAVSKDAASKDYLHTTGPAVIASPVSDVANETFRIVFASPTTYNIVYEDGTTQSGGPFNIATSTVDVVSNVSAGAVVRIYTADWDATTGAYAAGDEFVFYTSKQYASADLQPVALIQELLSQAGRDTSYNVILGTSQGVYYDSDHWDDVDSEFSTTKVRGYWPRGSNLMEMIQGLLRAMNASIYPSTDGRIAIWHLAPGSVGTTTGELSGEPDADVVSISDGYRLSGDDDLVNSSTWTYGHLDFTAGDDGSVPDIQTLSMSKDDFADTPFVDPISGNAIVRHRDVAVGWAVDSVTIDAASNRHLNRFREDTPIYVASGGLARILSAEITDAVTLTEPFLAEASRKIQVEQIGVRLLENAAELLGRLDPVLASEYAIVGTSLWDGSDLVF